MRRHPDGGLGLRLVLAGLAVFSLCAGIVLAMNTATADGSRALYGISQDGMTIRWLGKLNRKHVPGNAMTLDAVLNLVLLCTYAYDPTGAIKILIFSNLGYVTCHVFAMSGFLLLRKDRPNWPRPIRLGAMWAPIAALLAAINLLFIVGGGFIWADKYGYFHNHFWEAPMNPKRLTEVGCVKCHHNIVELGTNNCNHSDGLIG